MDVRAVTLEQPWVEGATPWQWGGGRGMLPGRGKSRKGGAWLEDSKKADLSGWSERGRETTTPGASGRPGVQSPEASKPVRVKLC